MVIVIAMTMKVQGAEDELKSAEVCSAECI